LSDIDDGRIDVVVAYEVDRLTRSLADFAKMVEIFDAHQVSFVSITQQFNTHLDHPSGSCWFPNSNAPDGYLGCETTRGSSREKSVFLRTSP
jgi:hypothetical protein